MTRLLRGGPWLAAVILLFAACFHEAFLGEQFDFRDAAHFYYPLYQRVQMEWEAGRWPLWEPEENSGMPLLGNPTAAVLYPGKLIYAALPYPLAARTYVIVHVLISVVGASLLARNFGIGWAGSGVAGIAYAFSAPILFQYCNIIFLVGGAWTPFGLRAVDRWIRGGRRSALVELAIVLALQVLGGDPQSAYFVGLCAGGYALGMAYARNRAGSPARRGGVGRGIVIGAIAIVVWVGLVLAAAAILPGLRPPSPRPPTPTFAWSPWVSPAVMAAWAIVGLLMLRGYRRGKGLACTLLPILIGLAVAAMLAAALSAAQLLPVMEFTSLTSRSADEGSHDIYPFSLEPVRLLEFALPNVFGSTTRGNHSWVSAIPPSAVHRIWVPSLYAGGTTLILALAAFGFRRAEPWRGWMSGILVLSLLGAFGEFGSPLFWARGIPALESVIGPRDPENTNAIRMDRHLRDGDGSLYWAMSIALPGFQGFRYPSKLLSLSLLAMAVLAGAGLERLLAGDGSRARRGAIALLVLTVAGTSIVTLGRSFVLERLRSFESASGFGPFQPEGALEDLTWAVIQGLVVGGSTMLIWMLARRRPGTAGALATLVIAIDLAIANAPTVLTAPQSEFDAEPKYLAVIAEAEKKDPAGGPFRIHRMPIWNPAGWALEPSPDRVLDFLRWERDTLQPKYGITRGVEYTYTQGTAELFDYEWFFGPFDQPVTPALAAQLGKIGTHERIIYYPRRGFDLWNTRYFILPGYTVWTDVERGVASLLQDADPLYPDPRRFTGPDRDEQIKKWLRDEDIQIVRNRNFMPRAWIVHQAWFKPPIKGLSREQRARPMEEMTFADDSIWRDPNRVVHDPRRTAWIEDSNPGPIQQAIMNTRAHSDEYVRIVSRDPQRVELEARLVENGIVILADTLYPGWKLEIDGKPAPILRTNRLMRGALVEGSPQPHRLVYSYDPNSFRVGRILSLLGIAFAFLGFAWSYRSDRKRGMAAP
ncbi:MAG: hypothetical protein SFX72_10630 [Isosphaeraceae bacterium]|nr:hypothetical protein [Isosphaeraceae bacterium]